MFRLLIAGAAALAVTAVQAQETTRILERPVYGATVTIEQGVRVFRPIPADGHVIINPGGRTPVIINSGVATGGVPAVGVR